jgi:transposase
VPRSRPPYPPEFRVETIRLVKSSGDSIRRIAEDLGISDQTLRNWVKQDDVDAGRKSGLTSALALRELEKESRRLREEREILRKPRPSSRARPGGGRRGASLHPRGEGHPFGHPVSSARGLALGLLCRRAAAAQQSGRRAELFAEEASDLGDVEPDVESRPLSTGSGEAVLPARRSPRLACQLLGIFSEGRVHHM